MHWQRLRGFILVGCLSLSAVCSCMEEPPLATPERSQLRAPDVPYVPTPQEVVVAMLYAANVGPEDILYDLGCGDGRIVVTAARQFGARATGVDLDPERLSEARANARRAGVTDRVRFLQQDLFETELRDATVVTLYLLPKLNLRLRPRLLHNLKPGARIVSHAFDMAEWQPDQVVPVRGDNIYLLSAPAQATLSAAEWNLAERRGGNTRDRGRTAGQLPPLHREATGAGAASADGLSGARGG
jgi:SAM-dependent methyltransferase